MKKTVFTLLAVMASAMGLGAAQYQYVPMVQEGVKWVYAYTLIMEANENNPRGIVYYAIELKGDTLIGGEQYKKAYRYFLREHKEVDPSTMYPVAYVLEEDKKVYGINNDNIDGQEFYNSGSPTSANIDGKLMGQIDGHDLYLMYDFENVYQYYSSRFYNGYPLFFDSEEGTIEIDRVLRKTYALSLGFRAEYSFAEVLVEGIGFDMEPPYIGDWLNPFVDMLTCQCDAPLGLSHVENADGKVIYKGLHYDPTVGVDDVLRDFFPADGRYYNLQGMPVADPTAAPGIYIHNGRKILIK